MTQRTARNTKWHRYAALWFIFCALLSIFNICTIYIFDGSDWPYYAVLLNAVVSLIGIIYHMHADERRSETGRIRRAIPHLILALNSLMVFPMLFLSLFTLSGEYHNPLTADATITSAEQVWQTMDNSDKNVMVLQTDDLYIYCANYNNLAYVTEDRPSQDDKSNLLCVAAAFQSTYQLDFNEDNIVGWHTSKGRLERGAPQDDLGAFTYVDGVARIWNIDEAEGAVREAADKGGQGYQSFIVLKDGERGDFRTHEFRCFRVLAILDGRVCIIDSRTLTHFDEFVQKLQEFGVRDAVYSDMGSGWNYSWYRDANGNAQTIIGMPWPFSHNWLTFRM